MNKKRLTVNFTWVEFGKLAANTLGQINDPGDGYYDDRLQTVLFPAHAHTLCAGNL